MCVHVSRYACMCMCSTWIRQSACACVSVPVHVVIRQSVCAHVGTCPCCHPLMCMCVSTCRWHPSCHPSICMCMCISTCRCHLHVVIRRSACACASVPVDGIRHVHVVVRRSACACASVPVDVICHVHVVIRRCACPRVSTCPCRQPSICMCTSVHE